MYCKNCGAENPSTANYCVNDGSFLKSTPVLHLVKGNHLAFCPNCGSKTYTSSNYCQNCGESLFQYGREKNFVQKTAGRSAAPVLNSAAKLPAFQLQYIKKAVIPALLAIIVVFLLAFLMLKSSEKLYDNMLNSEMNNYNFNSLINEIGSETNTNLPKAGNLIGISDIVMLANLQNPDITIKGNGGISLFRQNASLHVITQNGFLIYLLIPFIGLFAAGILAGRKNQRTGLSARIYDAAGIALIYSVFFTIVSFFAGFSYHVNLNVDPGNVVVDINTNYSFITTFFMTLLFGFIFSFLGILFSINFKKITGHLEEWVPFGRAIHQAVIVPLLGFLILFVSLFVYFSSKFSDFKEQFGSELTGSPLAELLNKSTSMIVTLSFQLGAYLWNLLHFEPFTLSGENNLNSGTGSGTISYSIFSGFNSAGSATNNVESLQSMLGATDIEMYLKFALIIPIALFIWAGFRISKQPNRFKNLLVFSIVYALIMAGVSAFSNIGFNFNGNIAGETGGMSMSLGFGAMGTFFRSLIFSLIFAYLGTWITKLKPEN